MSKSLVVSYHMPSLIKDFIDKESKKLKLAKGKFLAFLVEDYKKTKEENLTLKSYFDMATDKEFLKEQIMEAEEDLLVELAYKKEN